MDEAHLINNLGCKCNARIGYGDVLKTVLFIPILLRKDSKSSGKGQAKNGETDS
jgi:hypothetical protein